MKQMLKVILCVLLACNLSVMTVFAKPDWPADTRIEAEAGIIVDADSGAVLFGKNIHETYAPASITKLMTALVVIENRSLDEVVEFSHDAIYNVEAGSSNKLGLEVGDRMPVRDCLYAMLLQSSNQAANALAEHVAGSRDAFAQMMNDKVEELGCRKSHFVNPSGLNDDAQVVTAYDMALIARAAFANPVLMEIDSTLSYKLPPITNHPDGMTISMEHKLLVTTDTNSQFYCPGAKAGKTGYTSKAGNTLVTYAEREGRRVISVVLKGTQPQYYLDTKTLLDFGFARFQTLNAAENETAYVSGEEAVAVGGQSYAPSDLKIDPQGMVTLPNGAAFSDADKTLAAALPADSPENAVGLIEYSYNDRKVGSAFLCLKALPVLPEETEPAAAPALPEKEEETLSHDFRVPIAFAAVFLVFAGACACGVYLYLRRKREREAAELRRERRRQRLREVGCSEEEFERLKEQRYGSSRKAGKS